MLIFHLIKVLGAKLFSGRAFLIFLISVVPSLGFSDDYLESDSFEGPRFNGIGPQHDRIAVDVVVSSLPERNQFTALDLSAEGQAAFIKVFEDNPDNLISALTTPIQRDTSQSLSDKLVLTVSRRFNFSLLTKNMRPLDGIVEAHITAELPEFWHFKEWSGFTVLEADISTRTASSSGNRVPNPEDAIDRVVQSVTRIGTAQILPRLENNLAEFILTSWPRRADLSGSYSVDLTLEYVGPTGWVRTTDIALGLGDSVEIRRAQTSFPVEVMEGQLNVRMPYVLRRVDTSLGPRLLTDEDKATYTFVDGSAGLKHGFAKVGLEAPQTSYPLGLEEASNLSLTVLFLEDKPLKIYVPGPDANPESSACIISADARQLAAFSLWVTEDPAERTTGVGASNNLLYQLMLDDANGDPKRVDPGLIVNVNGGSTIEVRQFSVNHGSVEERLAGVLGRECALDIPN